MQAFNILALDSNFQIVGIVAFNSLQWTRKWHQSGSFSIIVPLEQYSADWKYIYTNERPEVGEISQINYSVIDNSRTMTISGYFLEHELDRMFVYQKPRIYDYDPNKTSSGKDTMSNIINGPEWEHLNNYADVIAHGYFNAFKYISFNNKGEHTSNVKKFSLDIEDGSTVKRNEDFKMSDHYRNGESLAYKIYDILKPSGASFRVDYDFKNNKKIFNVIGGRDRREGTSDPIIFSTRYGNIFNPNVVISNTDRVDSVLVSKTYSIKESENKTVDYYAVIASCADDASGIFAMVDTGVNPNDYKLSDECDTYDDSCYNTTSFKKSVYTECDTKIDDLNVTLINIEFDSTVGTYVYMDDFDIGDLVSLEIPEMKLSADVRLIGCYEVIENGIWTLTMEFGKPIIK